MLIGSDDFANILFDLDALNHNLSAAALTAYAEIRTYAKHGKAVIAAGVFFLHYQFVTYSHIHKTYPR